MRTSTIAIALLLALLACALFYVINKPSYDAALEDHHRLTMDGGTVR